MATILEAVGTYLVAEGYGTLGTNIFLGLMPDKPDVCIGVYENEGGAPDFTMGTVLMDNPAIQIIVRSAPEDYPSARDTAQSIRVLLSQVANVTLSGISVLRIAPTGSLLPMGGDTNDRPHVSANFRCQLQL